MDSYTQAYINSYIAMDVHNAYQQLKETHQNLVELAEGQVKLGNTAQEFGRRSTK
ncbi:hypothetical protein N8654_04345 [Synechococcus sp. AH-601-B19]|nr:hypothetical protein [Synechococcus sp. AH-601-B19]